MSAQNISRHLYGIAIQQRIFDGYINASQLCKAHHEKTGESKEPREWLSNSSTKSIIDKLAEAEEIPADKLTETKRGRNGGTWIHPRLAVRFAMWLNDDFSLQVEDWVQQWTECTVSPVQLAFSELRELVEIIEVSIKAIQMIHTASHGLTAILNMAHKKLHKIRENQANTFAGSDFYYKQVERVEEKIYELESKIDNLYLEKPDRLIPSVTIVDVEAQNITDAFDKTPTYVRECYEDIEAEAKLLAAKEEALLKPMVSEVGVAFGSFNRNSNKLEFQAIRQQNDITIYVYEWGRQIGCLTFNTFDYPYDHEYSFGKTRYRDNFCANIYTKVSGKYSDSNICSVMMRVIEEVKYNDYYWAVMNAQDIAELEAAKRLLSDNVPR